MSEYRRVAVPLDTLLYAEAVGNYVKLHDTAGHSVLSKMTMTHLLSLLPADEFVRIHRSYVVARARIPSFTKSQVVLSKFNITLPIGKRYADVVSKL